MSDDPQPDLRAATRALGDEIARALRQSERMIRAACDDISALVADRTSPPVDATPATPTQESPVDTLRQLAALHAEGVLTDTEFAAKKAELLERI